MRVNRVQETRMAVEAFFEENRVALNVEMEIGSKQAITGLGCR